MILKDNEPITNETVVKDDMAYKECLKSALINKIAEYMSSNDIKLLAESNNIMEALARLKMTKKEYRQLCRTEGGTYKKRRYEQIEAEANE